jgi:hypothetical protein
MSLLPGARCASFPAASDTTLGFQADEVLVWGARVTLALQTTIEESVLDKSEKPKLYSTRRLGGTSSDADDR